MEKELKINIPQGYEIDRQKSTFEKIVFKKIEPCKPTTWKEYCKYAKDCPSYYGNPRQTNICETRFDGFYNEFFTKERVKQYVALGKLLQLRDYWVGDWKYNIPAFDDSVFAVFYDAILNKAQMTNMSYSNLPLTFPTKEMAQKFIECFEDLIKEAYPLV